METGNRAAGNGNRDKRPNRTGQYRAIAVDKLRDGRECTIDLDSFEIKGRIAEREIREPLAWIAAQQDFLHDEWRRCNP